MLHFLAVPKGIETVNAKLTKIFSKHYILGTRRQIKLTFFTVFFIFNFRLLLHGEDKIIMLSVFLLNLSEFNLDLNLVFLCKNHYFWKKLTASVEQVLPRHSSVYHNCYSNLKVTYCTNMARWRKKYHV